RAGAWRQETLEQGGFVPDRGAWRRRAGAWCNEQ
ncbi:hypothetical protein A2U01_0117105, partial [Trifolium medium]|nr:hypothetical protein [Trifolium medium]